MEVGPWKAKCNGAIELDESVDCTNIVVVKNTDIY